MMRKYLNLITLILMMMQVCSAAVIAWERVINELDQKMGGFRAVSSLKEGFLYSLYLFCFLLFYSFLHIAWMKMARLNPRMLLAMVPVQVVDSHIQVEVAKKPFLANH